MTDRRVTSASVTTRYNAVLWVKSVAILYFWLHFCAVVGPRRNGPVRMPWQSFRAVQVGKNDVTSLREAVGALSFSDIATAYNVCFSEIWGLHWDSDQRAFICEKPRTRPSESVRCVPYL